MKQAFEPILGLCLLDMAAVEAYAIAVDACTTRETRETLESFRGDHERHVRELGAWLKANGCDPPGEMDASGETIRSYTELACEEERGAVLATMGNEELTNEAYASALTAEIPEDAREIVVRSFADERRHIAFLRGLVKLSGWDAEPPELRRLAEQYVRRAA